MSAHTLKGYETNQRKISENQATFFTEIFNALGANISDAFILTGNNTIKLNNPPIFHSSFSEEFQIEKEIDIIKHASPDLAFIKICDDTMFPVYKYGDVLAGKKISNAKLFERFIGQCCIIESITGEKVLRKILNTDTFCIHCMILNPMTKENINETHIIESTYIAQATRHWKVSELVQC